MSMTVPLSILDLAPIAPGETARDSFAASVALAQQAERSGYRRVWYAEHHNMASIASSATSVLIAHVASQTSTIRLGSGGVMLPNHSPLTIAEQFGTLETLHPGRIDLGLGRAPGSDQATFRALRRDPGSSDRVPEDVVELQAFLSGESQVPGVSATPGAGTRVPLYILGSSTFGAQLAAALGLPFAFASHFAPDMLLDAIAISRRDFRPSEQLDAPYAIAGINAIAADDRADAERQFAGVRRARLMMLLRQSGRIPATQTFTDEELDRLLEAPVGAHVASMMTYTAVGTGAEVSDYANRFAEQAGVDEVIVGHASQRTPERLRSVELMADAHAPSPRSAGSMADDAAPAPADARAAQEAVRADTLALIRGLDRDVAAIVESRQDANSDDEHDPDGATLAFERSQSDAMIREARVRLGDVDAAVARLDAGTYAAARSAARRSPRVGSRSAPPRAAASRMPERDGRPGWSGSGPVVVEVEDQLSQQPREHVAVGCGQGLEQLRLLGDEPGDRGVDARAARVRHDDADPAPVVRIRPPLHEPARHEPVDAVRHRAGGDERLLQEGLRAQLVGIARPSQRRQHVELPRLELRLLERGAPGALQQPRQAADARQHLERGEVEVGPLAPPRVDDAVDLVAAGHPPIMPVRGPPPRPRAVADRPPRPGLRPRAPLADSSCARPDRERSALV